MVGNAQPESIYEEEVGEDGNVVIYKQAVFSSKWQRWDQGVSLRLLSAVMIVMDTVSMAHKVR